jgi:hypothetical protein
VIVQKRKRIVKADMNAENILTILATSWTSEANRVKNLAINIKNGAPGGCPISNLYAVLINSPQSQKLAVGSIVRR